MNEILDIHNPFIVWLNERGIPFHRNRPDKRTTAIKGDPDFLLTWCSYCVYIECKVPGRKLSKDQEKRIAYLRKAGNRVVIAYSLQECVEAAQGIFCQGEQKNDVVGRTEPVNWPSELSDEERSRLIRAADAARERVSKMPETEREELMKRAFRSKPDPQKLYIADWKGTPWVCEEKLIGPDHLVRRAGPQDIRELPRK